MSVNNVSQVIEAPVVDSNPNSPASKMAADAKRLEVQSATDTAFDTVVERFCGDPFPMTKKVILLSAAILTL